MGFVRNQLGINISGGRGLKDEYGLYDGMTPRAAVVTTDGLTVAMYLTKPPVRGVNNQEIHLLKLNTPPAELQKIYVGRT